MVDKNKGYSAEINITSSYQIEAVNIEIDSQLLNNNIFSEKKKQQKHKFLIILIKSWKFCFFGKKGIGEIRENKPLNITEYDKNGNIVTKLVNGE